MKKLLLVIAILTAMHSANAQSFIRDWADHFPEAISSPVFEEAGQSVWTDTAGNVYTTGYFKNTVDFNPSAGINNLISYGQKDIFVSKVSSTGAFVWAVRFGGTTDDEGFGITGDYGSYIYITGYFMGNAVIGTPVISGGARDAFVSKISKATGAVVWTKTFSGAQNGIGRDIAVDNGGNIYTTGSFQGSVDFDPNAGIINGVSVGATDIYVSKLNSSGNYMLMKRIGGKGNDAGASLVLEGDINVLVTGYFEQTVDFNPGPGIFNLSCAGLKDVFVVKLATGLGEYMWAKRIGGADDDRGSSITLDAGGQVFTTGFFTGLVDFDPGSDTTYQNSYASSQSDMFISKLSVMGDYLACQKIGGQGVDVGTGIDVAPEGSVYLVGNHTTVMEPAILWCEGLSDIYIGRFDPITLELMHQEGIGDSLNDEATAIFIDDINNVHVTGKFSCGSTFLTNPSPLTYTSNGLTDIFILKFHSSSTFGTPLPELRQAVIAEHDLEHTLIYPNPSHDIFYLKITANKNAATNIKISDIKGRVVKQLQQTIVEGENNLSMDLSSFINGIYIVQVMLDNKIISTHKIIKE